jgi:hypothetical protein
LPLGAGRVCGSREERTSPAFIPHVAVLPPRGGDVDAHGILFIFDGGVLAEDELARIRLPVDELASFTFLPIDEIAPRVRPSMARRLSAALDAVEAGRPHYLQFGRKV